jgi:hypothetical protein
MRYLSVEQKTLLSDRTTSSEEGPCYELGMEDAEGEVSCDKC